MPQTLPYGSFILWHGATGKHPGALCAPQRWGRRAARSCKLAEADADALVAQRPGCLCTAGGNVDTLFLVLRAGSGEDDA